MSEQWQNLAGFLIIVGMGTAISWSFDSALMAPVVGHKHYWRKRGGPFVLGWWLPTLAILCGAIWLYADTPTTPGWHWLAVGAGVVAWLIFFLLRRAIVRRHRARRGHPPPAARRLTPGEFWWGIRRAPRSRVVVLAIVCAWALAGIIGSVLEFVVKR